MAWKGIGVERTTTWFGRKIFAGFFGGFSLGKQFCMLGSQPFEINFVREIPDRWQFCDGDLLWDLFQIVK